MERLVERVFGLVFAILGVECSTEVYRERVSVDAFCSFRSHGHGKMAWCAYSAMISARHTFV